MINHLLHFIFYSKLYNQNIYHFIFPVISHNFRYYSLAPRSSNDSQAHFKFLLRKRSLLTLESLFLRSKTASVLLLSEQ